MADLGAYGVVAQCFEYLCGLGDDGDIGPGLATEWTANADSTEWTFKLREGVKWQSGGDFTADDVVATMERIVAARRLGLGGRDQGRRLHGQPTPTRWSSSSLRRTPAFRTWCRSTTRSRRSRRQDFAAGTTLDAQPDGTGPWKLTNYDPTTGATFERNEDWWGGKTPLDGIDWQFFTDVSSMVTAMQSGSVDAIVQFSVVGGDALLNDDNFNTIAMRTRDAPRDLDQLLDRAVHRQAGASGVRPVPRP